jgi:hypothetical protein
MFCGQSKPFSVVALAHCVANAVGASCLIIHDGEADANGQVGSHCLDCSNPFTMRLHLVCTKNRRIPDVQGIARCEPRNTPSPCSFLLHRPVPRQQIAG